MTWAENAPIWHGIRPRGRKTSYMGTQSAQDTARGGDRMSGPGEALP